MCTKIALSEHKTPPMAELKAKQKTYNPMVCTSETDKKKKTEKRS
jgi:hypothetical protein